MNKKFLGILSAVLMISAVSAFAKATTSQSEDANHTGEVPCQRCQEMANARAKMAATMNTNATDNKTATQKSTVHDAH